MFFLFELKYRILTLLNNMIEALPTHNLSIKRRAWSNLRQEVRTITSVKIPKEKTVFEKFKKNLFRAMDEAEEFFSSLSTDKKKVKKVFIRPTSIKSFDILYLIYKNDFLAEEFLPFYTKAHDFAISKTTTHFKINITYASFSDKTNQLAIISDGYIFSHEKQVGQSRSAQ